MPEDLHVRLLGAIHKIQREFIENAEPRQIFDLLLAQMLAITESEYGFIGEILHDGGGAPYLKTHALTNIAWNEETRAFYDQFAPQGLEFKNLETLFGAVITSGKLMIANDPARHAHAGGLPPGHPPLNAFLGIPLYYRQRLIGMMGMANREGGYDQEFVDYLAPLVATCANVAESYYVARDRRHALEALERSRARLQLLNAIATGIRTGMSLGQIVEHAVGEISRRFPQYRVAYSTIDRAGQLRVMESREPEGMPALKGEGGDLTVAPDYLEPLQAHQRVEVADVAADDRLTALRDILGEGGTAALLDVPVHHSDELVGLLCFDSPYPHAWSRDEIETLEEISDYLALALRDAEAARERERAEEALRESEHRFRQLTETIREVFWLKDAGTGEFVYVSPAYESLWGMSPDELKADRRAWFQAIHPEDRARVERDMERQTQVAGLEIEYRLLMKGDAVRWIRDRSYPIEDGEGAVSRIAGVAEDITERKQLEAQIQHAQKLESLGVLAGGIAHDFNNLLLGVLGNADLALSLLSPESPGRSNIEAIAKTAERAADLCQQMLAYSGRGKFIVQPIDLSSLVQEMTHLMEITISKKAVLRFDISTHLPAIEADATQVRQIVMNLIANASDAIGDKSGIITITTGAMHCTRDYLRETHLPEDMPEGTYVYLEVADTGCGMDEETRSKVFDPFFTTKFVGRGLGLAAVLGIVRSHRGAIKIYTEPGRGSTFKALFPASPKDAQIQELETEFAGHAKGTGTILVVDDEETVRAVARQILEASGFTVVLAADGREGVAAFRAQSSRIVCVILDMTMPHLSGEEAFRQMRQIDGDVPVILSSGYNEQEATSRFSGKGLAGFIQKPYRARQLIEAVHGVLPPRGEG